MIPKNISQQLDTLPTLVEKLRFIEKSFPTDDETLKQVAREAGLMQYKHEMPLFADQAETEVPEVTELSVLDVYAGLAILVSIATHYFDAAIQAYSGNPLIADAIAGKPLHKRFNSDRKNWEDNKTQYTDLIGESDPGKVSNPRVPKKTADLMDRIFMAAGIPLTGKIESTPCDFIKKQLEHPIAFIENQIYHYNQRIRNRESMKERPSNAYA